MLHFYVQVVVQVQVIYYCSLQLICIRLADLRTLDFLGH